MSRAALVTRDDLESLGLVLVSTWWMLAMRGLAALFFGAFAVLWPELALSTITALFGAYALVDAAAALASLALGRGTWRSQWWVWVVVAVGAAAGMVAFLWPGATAMLVMYLIAAWACVSGTVQLVGARLLRRELRNEWLLLLSGAVSIFFGAMIFILSGAGTAALTPILALYSLIYGAVMIGLSIGLRHRKVKAPPK
jgi:uncharacterized membrane protein HdeD (DUF308 family)